MTVSPSVEDTFIAAFDRKVRFQGRLNILFAFLLFFQLSLFVVFFPFFMQSSLIAASLALIIFTIFAFLVLKQYLLSQKLVHFEAILNDLLNELEMQHESSKKETHIQIAKTYAHLSERLYNHEYGYYPFLKRLPYLSGWIEIASAFFHWRDVQDIRELLLKAATEEYIAFVRKEPTNPEAHALLANAYVMLSGLYIDPRNLDPEEKEKWVSKKKFNGEMEAKFKDAAKKAIEEFKILKDYAPNDPWVYTQLAYSYRDLQMPEKEKESYEAILSLRPHDHETRYKLGVLCFERGENARGLQVYEDLKKAHFAKADELVKIYGGASLR